METSLAASFKQPDRDGFPCCVKMSLNSSRSASSKRSLSNSNNSNGNSSKKSKQKTLGMAWGANSHSSSRSSFRNSPFSDFGSYMVEKNRKLHIQFDAEASGSSHDGSTSKKPMFHGVSIFVDGFTVPSSQELRGYMLKHGGRFENYFSRHRVTHIICSNLPDSKVKNLRSFSGGLPVVKPAWILDSVVANRLLSWVPYQLDQLADNQPKLSEFFAVKSNSVSENVLTSSVCEVNSDPSLKGGTSKDINQFELGEHMKIIKDMDGQSDDPEYEIDEPSTSSSGKCSEVRMCPQSNSDIESRKGVDYEIQSSLGTTTEALRSVAISTSSNHGHSTRDDPNFVENYFKSSRLHFIGTWRNRYRKKFPSSSVNLKSRSSIFGLSDNSQKATIFHVDMDCFFVSVVIRNHPELQDKPVAVCHSDNPKGTAEISSANYPARDYGIKAGIFVRDAKALCPHLIIFPYNFEAYEEVADQFYDILHKHSRKVQAVSCDEAFLDVTDTESTDPELLASTIRKEIFQTTGCTASIGIAGNMLMARLATRAAKPNGQCCIPPEKVGEFLHNLPIKALPGIGYVLENKLRKQNIETCGQLRLISKDSLQKDFGVKTGEMLWNYSRGIDNRLVGVIQESKSIGAEVNWGVRFKNSQDSQHFLLNLCKEVSLRLQGCGVQGRKFTLKIKKRRINAEEPIKYMGCGDCENLSHSTTVPSATDDVEVLQRITKQLFGLFHLDVKEIRGVGLQVSKLEHADSSKQGLERNSLKSWLTSASTDERCNINVSKEWDIDSEAPKQHGTSGHSVSDSRGSVQTDNNMFSVGARSSVSDPPPLCHLDMGVVESLPPELFSELNETYGGKLANFIAKRRGKSQYISSSYASVSEQAGVLTDENNDPSVTDAVPLNTEMVKSKQHTAKEALMVPVSGADCYNERNDDVMPAALSQIDTSVLQQLPEELREDILGLLPGERRLDLTRNAALGCHTGNPQKSLDVKTAMNQLTSIDSDSNSNLWIGNPPQWVDCFKVSNSLILKALAEMYFKLGSTGNLSLILPQFISEWQHSFDESSDRWDSESVFRFCELLKQYVRIKIELDIEELYVCFRIIRRFTTKSKFVSLVYNTVFPYLQASVGEFYGGTFQISLNE